VTAAIIQVLDFYLDTRGLLRVISEIRTNKREEKIMLRKTLVTLSLILCMLALGTTTAYSSGYPAAALGTLDLGSGSTPINYVIVAKFNTGTNGFTLTEAETYSEMVVTAITSLLPSSGVTVFTPNQLTGLDADAARSLVASAYVQAGYEVFVFVDVKKAAAVTVAAGPNMRLDIYASGLLDPSEMYLASVEIPLLYINSLGGL
jgi:hypothetical protein